MGYLKQALECVRLFFSGIQKVCELGAFYQSCSGPFRISAELRLTKSHKGFQWSLIIPFEKSSHNNHRTLQKVVQARPCQKVPVSWRSSCSSIQKFWWCNSRTFPPNLDKIERLLLFVCQWPQIFQLAK